jgi:hypothetical protein
MKPTSNCANYLCMFAEVLRTVSIFQSWLSLAFVMPQKRHEYSATVFHSVLTNVPAIIGDQFVKPVLVEEKFLFSTELPNAGLRCPLLISK